MMFATDSKVAFQGVDPETHQPIWITGTVVALSDAMQGVTANYRDVRTFRWNSSAREAQEYIARVSLENLVWANELVPCVRCTRIHKPEKAHEPCSICKRETTA